VQGTAGDGQREHITLVLYLSLICSIDNSDRHSGAGGYESTRTPNTCNEAFLVELGSKHLAVSKQYLTTDPDSHLLKALG